LIREIDPTNPIAFWATDAFASDDLCRNPSVIDRAAAFASPASYPLDDQQFSLTHVIDYRHT
jgi:hypothetical protein